MQSKEERLEKFISKLAQQIDYIEGHLEQLKKQKKLLVEQVSELKKQSDAINIYCIASMSSGKSTLINAMLGEELMPVYNQACTATITRIKNNDEKDYKATVFDKDGNVIEKLGNLDYDTMKKLNDDDDVQEIHINGDIPFVSSKDTNLILVDTPGPNNSRNSDHQTTTFNALKDSPKTLVLYVLDGTQLGINDDHILLETIAKEMKSGNSWSHDRFIFVVNKMDSFAPEESITDVLNEVREYLEDMGIENTNIYPASSLAALGIRTLLSDPEIENIDEYDLDDATYEAKGLVRKLNRSLHLEEYAPLPKYKNEKISTELSQAQRNKDKNKQALIHSGIPTIEARLVELANELANK